MIGSKNYKITFSIITLFIFSIILLNLVEAGTYNGCAYDKYNQPAACGYCSKSVASWPDVNSCIINKNNQCSVYPYCEFGTGQISFDYRTTQCPSDATQALNIPNSCLCKNEMCPNPNDFTNRWSLDTWNGAPCKVTLSNSNSYNGNWSNKDSACITCYGKYKWSKIADVNGITVNPSYYFLCNPGPSHPCNWYDATNVPIESDRQARCTAAGCTYNTNFKSCTGSSRDCVYFGGGCDAYGCTPIQLKCSSACDSTVSPECDNQPSSILTNGGNCDSNCKYTAPITTPTTTTTTTIGPTIDTGLGNPIIEPTSPMENTKFTISCPANDNYNCILAAAPNKGVVPNNWCTFLKWDADKSAKVFECAGKPGGYYTAACAIPTGSTCTQVTTLTKYNVIGNISCGETKTSSNIIDKFHFHINSPTDVKITVTPTSDVHYKLFVTDDPETDGLICTSDKGTKGDAEICPLGVNPLADSSEKENQYKSGCKDGDLLTYKEGTYYISVKKDVTGSGSYTIKMECNNIPIIPLNIGVSKLGLSYNKAYFNFTLGTTNDISINMTPSQNADYDTFVIWEKNKFPMSYAACDYEDTSPIEIGIGLAGEEEIFYHSRLLSGKYQFMVYKAGGDGTYDIKVSTPPSNCPATCCQGNKTVSAPDFQYGTYTCNDGTNTDCKYKQIDDCKVDAEETDYGKDYMNKGICTDYLGCSKGSCNQTSYTDECLCSNKCKVGDPGCDSLTIQNCLAKTSRTDCETDPKCYWALKEYYTEKDVCVNDLAKTLYNCSKSGSNYVCDEGACTYLEYTPTETTSETITTEVTTTTTTIPQCSDAYTPCQIKCGDKISDKIDTSDYSKYYSFAITSPSDVTVNLQQPDSVTDYDLHANDDWSCPPVTACSNRGAGVTDSCSISGLEKGTYCFMISYFRGSGNYNLELACNPVGGATTTTSTTTQGGTTTTTYNCNIHSGNCEACLTQVSNCKYCRSTQTCYHYTECSSNCFMDNGICVDSYAECSIGVTTTTRTTTTTSVVATITTTSTTTQGGTTTTTTIPEFMGTNFDCSPILGGYKCGLDYTNNLDEDAKIMFIFSKSTGETLPGTVFLDAQQGSGHVEAGIFCSNSITGTNYARWKAFRASDTDYSDAIAWAKSFEWRSMIC